MNGNAALSSRHRCDMATIFDVFCEVGASETDALPILLTKYPEDYNEDAILKSVRQFSFPCPMKDLDSDAVQLFSFVLTDSQSKYTFGYCRYTPRNDTCICILSGFPWPGVFYKILNALSIVMNTGSQNDLDSVLTHIYHSDIPNIGDSLLLNCWSGTQTQELRIQIPDVRKLPTLREDKFMLEFYNAVSQRQMVVIFASVLKERRIIFTSNKLSQLSSCIYAASTLLRPMFWQSVFIPVLPDRLSDMIMAPMPFLIGVPKKTLQQQAMNHIGDVVLVDLDEKTLQSSHDDHAAFPNEVQSFLKSALKNSADMDDSMARTFLRANVLLFGGYRLGFIRNETTGTVTWDKERFISEQKPSLQPFLSSLIGADGVQYFERFIDERLVALNTGMPISDDFEKEIINMESRIKSQMKENSNDVIGALKEKVTGMQIASKLNKLTPKEVRRNKNWSLKKPVKSIDCQPMSFDNVQLHAECLPSSSSTDVKESERAETVAVANLIDFESPIEPVRETDPFRDLNAFSDTSLTAGQSTFYALPSDANRCTNASPPTVFADPLATPPPSQTIANARSAWEKFD